MSNTAQPPRTQIGVAQIIIERVEGPTDKCKKHTFTTYTAADAHLKSICDEQDPKVPGASKVDFRVCFLDGEDYVGLFQAAHPHSRSHEKPSLGSHIRRCQEYLAGLYCPEHMSQQQCDDLRSERLSKNPKIEQEAIHFLRTYALNDLAAVRDAVVPITEDDGRQAVHIADAATELMATLPIVSSGKLVYDLAMDLAIQQTVRVITLMEQEVERLKSLGHSYASVQNRAMTVRKALALLNTATNRNR